MDEGSAIEWHRDGLTVSTDPARLDVDLVASFLSETSYWAQGRPRATIDRSIANSVVFGVYDGERQIGFARVVTDHATFGWLCDVFVVPEARGRGVGVWLMSCVVDHPSVSGLPRLLLGTRDAHELYRRFGFDELPEPARFMIRRGGPPAGSSPQATNET